MSISRCFLKGKGEVVSMNGNQKKRLPELLAPAGSRESLCSAIEAGADAVYMGGEFNARAFAHNFDREAIREAISLCRAYGVKSYITLNTVVFEREMPRWLEYAGYLWECGADAFIIADTGAGEALRRFIPDVRLHASTQMSVHNTEGVRILSELGYERVVLAREMSGKELRKTASEVDTELEVFVHGALCTSASGQCLLSSLVGERSGNRGECAQPCRLPFCGRHILSLRDNCLAGHLCELSDMGISSLKIEGRMKSPEYVYGTVSAYRRLLDAGADATAAEIEEMSRLFSRSGFTDGYYTGKLSGMCGIRTDEDKKKSAGAAPFSGLVRKVPIELSCEILRGQKMKMMAKTASGHAEVYGGYPTEAQSAPLDPDTVKRSLCKLGGTPYVCEDADIALDDGLYARVSELNSLRRELLSELEGQGRREPADTKRICSVLEKKSNNDPAPYGMSVRFENVKTLLECSDSLGSFERIYLPIDKFYDGRCAASGIILPELVYPTEWEAFLKKLEAAKKDGARYAVASNISQIKAAKAAGFTVTADFRLNCTNPCTAELLLSLGADEVLLSPENKCAGVRDIHERKSVIVYGKIPVMLFERCPQKEMGGCSTCKAGAPYYLSDRTGAKFPVYGRDGHFSVMYNSVPVYTADSAKQRNSMGSYAPHFIFTDEDARTVRRVIRAYAGGEADPEKVLGGGRFRRLF